MTFNAATHNSAALSGLVFAAGVAHDATDGVPIVHEILGAVSAIVALAAKVDRNRAALHALADKAQKLARRITAVLANRAPEGEVLKSLEAIHRALSDVLALFDAHIARAPMRRAISYLLSVPKDVERLSADLGDALQEFLIVSARDTNVRVQANGRSIGPLRRMHDFEVEKLQSITVIRSDDGSCTVRYHSARVEGTARLFVVRSFEDAGSALTESGAGELQRRAEAHDGILAQISTVERSHPNIAYLYGRGTGTGFVVLRTGSYPLVTVPALSLTTAWSMMGKLLDAARHLTQFGAVWHPDTHRLAENVYLDERGEPTIGLIHDLQTTQSVSLQNVYESQLVMLSEIFCWAHGTVSRGDDWLPALSSESDWPYSLLQPALEVASDVEITYRRIQRSALACLTPLDHEEQAYLRAAEIAQSRTPGRAQSQYWSQALCRLATGRADWVGNGVYAAYHAASTHDARDVLFVHQVADDGGHVQHAEHRVIIPPDEAAKVRQALGIKSPESQSHSRITTFELTHVDKAATADGQWTRRQDK